MSSARTTLLSSGFPDALPDGSALQDGAFVVEKVLGQGGFGITYKGRDTALAREVAIKEFFPYEAAIRIRADSRVEPSGGLSRGGFETARGKFLEEARLVARFNHPGIVDVYTSFEEKNTAYMVMEYLHGTNLLQQIEARKQLPQHEAISIVDKIASALEVVHAQGLLHRDIKPENVLLCGSIANARVVLIDFGSARAFTANATTRLDVLVTPGYAPPEQYSDLARFQPSTDIYALGATLYHAVTGTAPPPADGREAGLKIEAPHELNRQLSREVSDAILWALQLEANARPQSVAEWIVTLRAARDAALAQPSNLSSSTPAPGVPKSGTPGRVGKPSTPRVASQQSRDPRRSIYKKLIAELDAPEMQPPPSPHEARLKAIHARLETVRGFVKPTDKQCPTCRTDALEYIAPAIGVARCPLCDGAMTQRAFDENLCPVCREGALKEYSFDEDDLFCPLCHVAPLKKEERKWLLIVDFWLSCPNCKAEWDIKNSERVILKTAGETARGQELLEESKSLREWKTLAARADRVLRCGACAAQFDCQSTSKHDARWSLVRFPNDPHGVGKQFGGRTFFRAAWARVAQGLPLGAGNCACRKCRAEWHFDATKQTLKLLQSEEKFAALRGATLQIALWRYRANGKTTDRAGHLCKICKTEFDDEKGLLKLVRAVGVLEARAGEKRSLLDWHRTAQGLPDSSEEAALRHEQTHLQNLKAQDEAAWRKSQKGTRDKMEYELKTMAAQSFLEGYLKARDASTLASLDRDARWQNAAALLQQTRRLNMPHWEIAQSGTLMLTGKQMVFFDKNGQAAWVRTFNKLRAATAPYVSGSPILEVQFSDMKNPLGFMTGPMKVDVLIEDRPFTLEISVVDVASWLNSRK